MFIQELLNSMDYSRIKIELDRKNLSVRDLCIKIAVTEQGLHQMIRNKSMKIEVLERISYVLGLPVSYWFDDATNTGNQVIPKLNYEKIDSLTRCLNEVLKEVVSK